MPTTSSLPTHPWTRGLAAALFVTFLTAAGCFLTAAGCDSTTTPGVTGGGGAGGAGRLACTTAIKPEPVANLGPDLTLHGACGGISHGAVASVGEAAGGLLDWNATIAGDPTLALEQSDFTSCALAPPQIAFVKFAPPLTAKPGDVADAVVTISASGDAFPPGTVKVHADVGAPRVIVNRQMIDFGEVAADSSRKETLTFRSEDGGFIYLIPPTPDPGLPFDHARAAGSEQPDGGQGPSYPGIAAGGSITYDVSVRPFAVGDYTTTYVWVTTADPDRQLPDGCTGKLTTSLHVRVVPPDGGASDAAD